MLTRNTSQLPRNISATAAASLREAIEKMREGFVRVGRILGCLTLVGSFDLGDGRGGYLKRGRLGLAVQKARLGWLKALIGAEARLMTGSLTVSVNPVMVLGKMTF